MKTEVKVIYEPGDRVVVLKAPGEEDEGLKGLEGAVAEDHSHQAYVRVALDERRGRSYLFEHDEIAPVHGAHEPEKFGAAAEKSQLDRIEEQQKFIIEVLRTMATKTDLDNALTALLAAEAARDAAVIKTLTDLQAKIAAGEVTTPEDFAAELSTVLTLTTNAAAITQTATADDVGPTDVTAPPAAPVDPAPVDPASVDPAPVDPDPNAPAA